MQYKTLFAFDDPDFVATITTEDNQTGKIVISPDLEIYAQCPSGMNSFAWLNLVKKVLKLYGKLLTFSECEDK